MSIKEEIHALTDEMLALILSLAHRQRECRLGKVLQKHWKWD